MSDRSMYSLTVDSVGVHPDGRVVRCPSDSQTGEDYGTIEGILGELQSLRKHVAEMSKECGRLKTENERLGAESAKRLADMHYLDVVLQGSRAKQDELKAENARLVREAAAGRLKPELNAIAVGNALIQPTSLRIELPGGVVITIPQPED